MKVHDKDELKKILTKDLRDDINCKLSVTRETDKWNAAPVLVIRISRGSEGTYLERISVANPVDGLIAANRALTRVITRELLPDMKFLCSFAVRHDKPDEECVQPMTNMGGVDMTTGFPVCERCSNGCELFKQEHEVDIDAR